MFQVFDSIGRVSVAQSVPRLVVALGMCIGGFSIMACTQPPAPNTSPQPTQVAQAPRVAGGAPPPTRSSILQAATSMLKQDYTQTAIPLAITLAPLAATETAQLTETEKVTQKSKALQVGFGRDIPATDRANILPRLKWTHFPNGMLVSACTVTSPQARSVRLALVASILAEGVEIRFFRPRSPEQSFGPFTKELLLRQAEPDGRNGPGSSKTQEGFWSPVIEGDSIGVEISLPSAEALQTSSVRLLQVSHMN